MDHHAMLAFITVAQRGTISRAAEHLHASQTTVGKRIAQLEEEVGARLFVRGKGHKKIALTAAGEDFLPLAERWLSLWSDVRDFSAGAVLHNLGVGIVESITASLIVPLFDRLYREAPQLRLRVITKHSVEMYTEVETRRVDIGFSTRELTNPYVVVRRLFSEPLVVIRPTGEDAARPVPYGKTDFPAISPQDLDADHEMFIAWHDRFQNWHDRHWDWRSSRIVTLNNPVLLIELLKSPEQWAIMPLSIAYRACRHKSLALFTLTDAPPDRVCYLLTHRDPKQSALEPLQVFERFLTETLWKNIPWAGK